MRRWPRPSGWPRNWPALGVRVLLDDRKASPGVKFKDAELLGVPTILIVGRGLDDGVVELRDREVRRAREDVPVAEAVARCRRRSPAEPVGGVSRLGRRLGQASTG